MNFVKKYGKFVLLGFFLCIFVLVVRQLLHSSLATFDETVYGFVSGFRSSTLTFIFRTISFFSGSYFLFILSLCLFFVFKSTKYSLLSLLNLIVIVLFNQGLKLLFSRPRPFEWMLVGETGYSFPSGHSMVSAAVYGLLIYLIFGKESTGIPKEILKEHLDRCYRLPMKDDARSLNLSNCVAIVTYEILRQQNYFSLARKEVLK